MRFSRSKLFGVYRELFRAIGSSLVALGLLTDRQDVFYLTMEELFAFVDGRAVTNNLSDLAQLRKLEFDGYKKGLPPPERFMTRGAVGTYFLYPAILEDLNLLKELERERSSDPNVLTGTPCCPGVVEGTVRVVTSIDQTEGLDGEILVTARTDPGWVPLYPLCSALVIERGSLLSHSAVVARELGLPTIVGVSGGLMKRLKTGMRVHVDAGKGKLTILDKQD
jgi:pyruvate,water dikinase